MLELKNNIMIGTNSRDLSPNGNLPTYRQNQIDIFNAMMKLSTFMLSRTEAESPASRVNGFDDYSRQVIKNVFNEQSCRIIEELEKVVEAQRIEIIGLHQELIDVHSS
jgi:hypothetical protein